ncbi:MAG TPA: ATP-binding protein, partial [Candidatus Thermoplasmatota archaeon]
PQSGASGGTALSTDVLRTIAKEGRKFGMGLLIVSQRPANVDKTVLSQCNTQIIMKVTNPNDLKAITASVEGLTGDAADEIQRLDVGVAMVAGAQLAQPVLVEVRTRQTKHGGRSVDVLGVEPEPEPPVPEPIVRTLPPSPVRLEEIHKVEHLLREAHEAPPEIAEAPLVTEPQIGRPKQPRPWGPEVEPEPPLVDGEIVEETEPYRPIPPRPPVALPKRDIAEIPAATLLQPEAEDPEDDERDQRLRPSLEPDDVLVHRVLVRVGYQTSSSREAMGKVRDLAKGLPEMSPDDYVRGFAKIGRNYCYPSHPECGPCPLLRTCRLGMERLGRGEVHQGRWGRKRR